MRIMLLLAALLFCGSALAFHCPMDMKKIDDALAAGPALSAEQLAEVKQLRAGPAARASSIFFMSMGQ